jgi:hypothetical protein
MEIAFGAIKSSLFATHYHRAIFDVCAEDAADRATRSRAVIDVFRNDVIAIGTADFARALVAFGPALAGIAAAAVDGEAGIAARQVGHLGRAGATAEAQEGQGGAARRHGDGR